MGVLSDWQIERDVKIEPFASSERRPGELSSGLSSYGYDVRAGYKFKIFSPIHATEIDPKNFDPKALEEVDLTPPTSHNWQMAEGFKTARCARCGVFAGSPHAASHDAMCFASAKPNFVRIPPHSFALAESLETFTIPRDVLCIVFGKSSYARCGLIINVTPGEPDWSGKWTIEISNTTPLPARVYAGEGIMQAIFLRSDGLREADHLKLEEYFRGHPFGHVPPMPTCRVSYADRKGKYQSQTGITLPFVESATPKEEPK